MKKLLVGRGGFDISSLLNQDFTFFNLQKFKTVYRCNINFLDYAQVIASIPREWKACIETFAGQLPPRNLSISDLIKSKLKICKFTYTILSRKLSKRTTHETKWNEDLNLNTISWEQAYLMAFKCTNDTKLRSFQYKILTGILITNKRLFDWKLLPTDACTFCGKDVETIKHIFNDCIKVKKLWYDLGESLLPVLDVHHLITLSNIIFCVQGHYQNADLINMLILLTKRFIYVQRCFTKPLLILPLRQFITNFAQMEISVVSLQRRIKNYDKWRHIQEELSLKQK